MRHQKKRLKLGTDASHRQAILRGLAAEVFIHEKIKTTETKAKQVRSLVEEIITLAKKGDIHARRQVLSLFPDRALVHKIFTEIGPRFAERNGGYTRILKIGPRSGDAAPMVFLELV